jgi:ADP-ribose pyrophosphatase YjhB (NUDIX family)
MRTFPSCWVCPGGGIEKDETVRISYDFKRKLNREI